MKKIDAAVLEKAMTYSDYQNLFDELVTTHKTTGPDQSEDLIGYTRMNYIRMARLEKTARLDMFVEERLEKVQQPLIWLVLVEAWCGDVAQAIPVMQHMAEMNDHIELRLILRDEHPEIMDAFLTYGTRSIPKLLILDRETRTVLDTWGPRPEDLQQLVISELKNIRALKDEDQREVEYNKLLTRVQKWYAHDRTHSIQREISFVLMSALKLPA